KKFCALFSKHFSVAYQLYTSLGNERLFRIVPVRIQKWIYGNGMPYIEIFDCENHKYKRTAYVVEE
ncbi:MAG TPA: pyridoxamine 5'-phosphate oxidase, partial [Ruminococcaceae bacterium]|nr:pyridoxamine 5'-phosphate oxidase [Oscillospiraceae bacterium]